MPAMTKRLKPWASVVVTLTTLACSCSKSPTSPSESMSEGTMFISGTVRDSALQPVAGARVEVTAGTLLGNVTNTDADGRFVFDTPVSVSASITLHISKDGFQPATIPVRANAILAVTLLATRLAPLSGPYTLTLRASTTCSELPPDLRSRTYLAAIDRQELVGAHWTGRLSGATFQPAYETFFGVLSPSAARVSFMSYSAFSWWLEEQPIIEQLGAGYLSVIGTATLMVGSGSPLTATLGGTWSYCSAAAQPGGPNWPLTCATAVAECRATDHQLTLAPR